MPKPLDIRQLQRVADAGEGTDVVPVSRNWLRAALKALQANQFPVLDTPSVQN